MLQCRLVGKRGVIQSFGIRRCVLPPDAKVKRKITRYAEVILGVYREIVLAHVSLARTYSLLSDLRRAEQEIGAWIAGTDARAIHAGKRPV